MAGGEAEIGDKVSWNWGGGAPGGTVVEKKTEGEIAIKSKRGNTIKKNASKDNPAVHISRSGNDVVKRVSELNVDRRSSGEGAGSKRKYEGEEEKESHKEDEIEENDAGNDVRSGGKKSKKENKEEMVNEKEAKEDSKPKENEKKKSGRPKGGAKGGAKKEKKPSKPRNTEGVSGRTRSQKK